MGVWEEKRKMVFWSPFVLLSTADLSLQCFLYQLAACPHRKGRGNDDLQLPKTALQLVVDARHPRSHSVAETFLLLSREKRTPRIHVRSRIRAKENSNLRILQCVANLDLQRVVLVHTAPHFVVAGRQLETRNRTQRIRLVCVGILLNDNVIFR